MKLRRIASDEGEREEYNVCPKSELHVVDFFLWVYDQAMSLSESNFWTFGGVKLNEDAAPSELQRLQSKAELAQLKEQPGSIPYQPIPTCIRNKRRTRVEQSLTRPVSVEG